MPLETKYDPPPDEIAPLLPPAPPPPTVTGVEMLTGIVLVDVLPKASLIVRVTT